MSKSNVLKVSLLGLSLMGLTFGFTYGLSIDTSIVATHSPRIYNLYLGSGESVGIKTTEDNLIITNGIVIGDIASESLSTAASIGGGIGNTIDSNSDYAGIGGGEDNHITSGENSIIGGGLSNTVDGGDAIVAGGEGNKSYSLGNVMGGIGNTAQNNGVVLGGDSNTADENSLALGAGSNAKGKSFAWNATAEPNSARIDASRGILIGTTQPITGVNLVVNGAMKIGGSNDENGVAGEIRFVSGCFYAYDGIVWHIINRNSTGECNAFSNISKACRFGNIELQEGDVVTGYKVVVTSNCNTIDNKREVKCHDGILVDPEGNTGFNNAYCYTGRGYLIGGGIVDDELDAYGCDGSEFTYGTITITDPSNASNKIIMMDRNLGAITNDISKVGSYGCYYQQGNNYGFPGIGDIKISNTWVDASGYGPSNYYESDTFIAMTHSPWRWDSSNNHNLWGGLGDTATSRGAGTDIDRQGPCPSGWHVPSASEWTNSYNRWCSSNPSNCSSDDKSILFLQYFNLPMAGQRRHEDGHIVRIGVSAEYRSSSPDTTYPANNGFLLHVLGNKLEPHRDARRSRAYPIRCFKNS